MRRARLSFVFIFVLIGGAPISARAETVLVAVAANFKAAISELATIFEAETGHQVEIAVGSTGHLYAQIVQGAPFDLFLAADADRPARLASDGLVATDGRAIYAIGRLALYDPRAAAPPALAAVQAPGIMLAIANPRTAPYGAAARTVLERAGSWRKLTGRIAMAQNAGGVAAMTQSGAADLAFVALSALRDPARPAPGAYRIVPNDLHAPLRQEMALLARAGPNKAARALYDFILSEPARETIRRYGYDVE